MKGSVRMKGFMLLDVDLSLFDGEGSAPAPTGGQQTGSTEGVAGPTSDTGLVLEPQNEGGADNEPAEKDPKQATKDPMKEFETLIKGDYKEAFDKRVQDIINKRFKDTKQLEKKVSQLDEFIEVLQHKYGTDNADEIKQRLESEVVEELAYQNDMSPENYRKIMEAERIKRQEELRASQIQQQELIRSTVEKWESQAMEYQKENPDFNLREAMQNDQFLDLIKSNIPVKTAYELLNFDKLKDQIRKEVETNTVKNIQAKKSRAPEAALKGQTGTVVKSDVKSLTKEQRAEIAARVQRGEKITF